MRPALPRPSSPWCLAIAATALALPASAQAPTVLTPAVAFSVHDEPVDGLGDTFNGSPFEGLIRFQSTRADRAMQEFDVTPFISATIGSATLSGRVSVNNAFNNGVRTFDFVLYAGNGVADLTDYETAAVLAGTGQYSPPTDSFFDFSFDVTPQVSALLAAGATHVGLRAEATSNPNFPNVLSFTEARLEVAGPAPLGSSYCGPAATNSTGLSASIRAEGNPLASANNVRLVAGALPTQSFGFFLTSRAQGFAANPGGSQGNLCLGNPIGRYVGPGQVQNSGATGSFALQLDLSQTPTPTGFVAAVGGETWNFQAWYRDAVGAGATSNFTDGVSVPLL